MVPLQKNSRCTWAADDVSPIRRAFRRRASCTRNSPRHDAIVFDSKMFSIFFLKKNKVYYSAITITGAINAAPPNLFVLMFLKTETNSLLLSNLPATVAKTITITIILVRFDLIKHDMFYPIHETNLAYIRLIFEYHFIEQQHYC